jgi:hypothetical protein
MYDPIEDFHFELLNVRENIERYKRRNRIRQIQEQEEKFALLFQII